MTSLDVLFWFMILLLGGVAWAIEAGLTMRHRRALMASTLSCFSALVFFMFWIEDESSMNLGQKAAWKRQGGEQAAEEPVEAADDGAGAGGSGGSGNSGDSSAAGGKSTAEAKKASARSAPAAGDKKPPVVVARERKPAAAVEPPEYSTEPFRDCLLCPEMVIITPKDGGGPAKPFAIGRLHVLRKEFASFVQSSSHAASETCDIQSTRKGKYGWRNPGFEQDGRHPVVCISPQDADVYVEWISGRTNRDYRLLSESDWELAARGGTDGPYWQGPSIQPSQANFGRFRDGTIPAGSLPANKYGLSDINGNVWHILGTCGSNKPLEQCAERALKGGAWNSPPEQLRIDAQLSVPAGAATNYTGFRVARDVDQRDSAKILSKAKKAALAADDKAAAEIDAKERAAAQKAEFDRLEAAAKAAQPPPAAKK